jgi:Ser/Thr protein kinase RdoA (MazF antagonist)
VTDAAFASLQPLEGGWSGETFVAEAAGERQVVRIYARDPGRAEVDAALLRLVRGLVPVAEVLEVRPPAAATPALLVTSYLPGVRGDLVLPTLDDEGLSRLGRRVGTLVATLGGMPVLVAGAFVGADLRIEPWDLPGGLVGWAEQHLGALGQWSREEQDRLLTLCDAAQGLLDTLERRCLVHGDLNPKNLLVDPETLEVTGVVDWEYAHAGHPFTDLGNVLRFEGDGRWQPYAEAVLAACAERLGTPPEQARVLAGAADLWALVDLAAHRDDNPVAARAHDRLRALAAADRLGFDTVEVSA